MCFSIVVVLLGLLENEIKRNENSNNETDGTGNVALNALLLMFLIKILEQRDWRLNHLCYCEDYSVNKNRTVALKQEEEEKRRLQIIDWSYFASLVRNSLMEMRSSTFFKTKSELALQIRSPSIIHSPLIEERRSVLFGVSNFFQVKFFFYRYCKNNRIVISHLLFSLISVFN